LPTNFKIIHSQFVLQTGLRVEWCKGKACQDRWQEEVELLLEERRRILVLFDHRAKQWDKLAEQDQAWMLPGVPMDEISVNGRVAYAREQAMQYRTMRAHCVHMWVNIDMYVGSEGVTPGPKHLVPRNMMFDSVGIDDEDESSTPREDVYNDPEPE